MTTEELQKHKADHNSKIAKLKKEFIDNQIIIDKLQINQPIILARLFEAIDDHEKVCEEFDREKE